MLFKIDFTRPHLYEDVVTLNQGNLSTNNTLRCRVVTGGNDDVTGATIVCTFVINGKQVFESGKVVDGPRGIVDVVFPSEALVVGENTLEFLVNRVDGSVAQSPVIKYRVWQGLTTDEGVRADSNYPLLIELIGQVNEAVVAANKALEGANSVISQGEELKASVDKLKVDCIASVDSFTEESTVKIDNTISQNVAKVDAAIVKNEASVVKANAAAEKAILAANNSDTKTAENIKNVNAAIAAGTKDLEVKSARIDMDGKEHGSLKERLESDLKKGKLIEETKEGACLSFNDTVGGLVSDIEVFGNTVQDISNLSNIRSSCVPNGDGTFKMSILSAGENLDNSTLEVGIISSSTGENASASDYLRTKEFVRCNSNTQMYFSNTGKGVDLIFFYDKDRKFIGKTNVGQRSFVTPSNCYYIRYRFVANSVDMVSNRKLQEGTVATPYTPYQETRCDIKLPCQLEKWDKLYFDKEENAWVVDKWTLEYSPRNQHYTINALNNVYRCFPSNATLENAEYKNDYGKTTTICKGLPFIQDNYFARDEEHYYIDPNAKKEYLFFNKNKFDGTSDGLNKYFESIDFYMLIKLASPQRIVLPQSEQIKLNSFASKTHIYAISGEVDATVKATVSKSLASAVQANTEEISKINNTISDMQGLKESQDFAYELPSGQNYLVCKDTQNGVVKDLKINGKSLVQVYPQLPISEQNYIYNAGLNGVSKDGDYITLTGNGTNYIDCAIRFSKNELFKPSTEYTFFIEIVSNTVKGALLYNTEYLNRSMFSSNTLFTVNEGFTGIKIVKATTKDSTWFNDNTIDNKTILRTQLTPNNTGSVKYRIWALEGSHDEVVPFFKGIASVGSGNEIEVSSRKEDANIFENDVVNGKYNTSTGIYESDSSVICSKEKIWVIPTNVYSISNPKSGGQYRIFEYDINKNFLSSKLLSSNFDFNVSSNTFYINIQISKDFAPGIINIGKKGYLDINFKQDKKPILFKDTDGAWKPVTELRGIINSTYDTVENSKYNKKLDEIILDETLNYTLWKPNPNAVNTIMFSLSSVKIKRGSQFSPISNLLVNRIGVPKEPISTFKDLDKEGIGYWDSTVSLFVSINKSQLETPDVTGFKKLLKKWKDEGQPLKVIYEKEVYEQYEVNPLDLQSFENETMILIDGGVVSVPTSFKITSNLTNFVQNIEGRVCRLENDTYKTNLANFAVALNMLDMKARLRSLEVPIN